MAWLPLPIVRRIEPYAAQRSVGDVTRGARGFVRAYEAAEGVEGRLGNVPGRAQTWAVRRNAMARGHLEAIKRESLYEWRGPYKGWPTRRHLALLLWACAPDLPGLLLWLNSMAETPPTRPARSPREAIALLVRLSGHLRRQRVAAIQSHIAAPIPEGEDRVSVTEARWARVIRELGYTGSTLGDLAAEAGLPLDLLEDVAGEADPGSSRARARAHAFLGGATVEGVASARTRAARRYGWTPGVRARYPQGVESPVDRCLHAAVDVAALAPHSEELLALCEDAVELAAMETP